MPSGIKPEATHEHVAHRLWLDLRLYWLWILPVRQESARCGAVRGGDSTRNLLTVYLAKRGSFHEGPRLTIGGGHCGAAARAAGETAVHPIAVGVIGNDEYAFFGMRGRAQPGYDAERRENAHRTSPPMSPESARNMRSAT